MSTPFILGALCGASIAVGVCNWSNKTVVVLCAVVALLVAVVAGAL